jgi:hypothetical protein
MNPSLAPFDFFAAAAVAVVFALLVSIIPEPARQRWMAVLVAGAGGAYLSSGLGFFELALPIVVTVLAYAGLRSYRFIAVAWLCHVGWDVLHHLYARPILPFAPTSSGQCAIADTLIAVWFFAGAPSIWAAFRSEPNRISSGL